MGIRRYHLVCAGCKERIRLRFTVGRDRRQPFYFPCPVCGAPTRGVFEYLGGHETKLELEAGELIAEEVENAPAVSISADIPSVAAAKEMWDDGGSAFMHFTSLIGMEKMQRFLTVTDRARDGATKFGPVISRLVSYYSVSDWARFDSNAVALLPPGAHPPVNSLERIDLLHRAFDALVAPVVFADGSEGYAQMKMEWNGGLWSGRGSNADALLAFGQSEASSPKLMTCHRDLLACLERYVANFPGIFPGLLCNLVPQEEQSEIDQLRLFRDDFEALRDLYVNAFEACHKSLRWIIGAANVAQRASADRFLDDTPSAGPAKKPLRSMKDFDKIVNAEKRKYLACLPTWNRLWDGLLDRPLRNDFGHASARHDLRSGSLHRDGHPDLHYPRFLQRVHRMGHAILACTHALKLIRISGTI
jgi:hypothetical protein